MASADSTTALPAPRGYARVLACALCQHRKVKCDRNSPCSNCVKAGVPCTPSTPTPVRQRRRPNQDLRQRLARCEELLLQYAGGAAADQVPARKSPEGQTLPTRATHEEPQPRPEPAILQPKTNDDFPQPPRPACVIVQDEGSTRLMDSYLWATLYEELRSMRDIVETEDASVLGCEETIPDSSADLLLSGVDPSINVDNLHPNPVHVFRLWQLFLDRVNPLTKIIHAPTVQPYVIEAAANIHNVPLHHQALLFSIYTMAVVSLSGDECVAMFDMSRDTALRRYTLGAKVSLTRFNFLKNENMAILQALILFLCSLQGRYDGYACWIISGIIVRIAQKMGYHRDGEAINLGPFETEMRRRIWWQIVVRDSTHSAASRLTPSLLPANWDTKEPQNLNDVDLFPNSTEPACPREGPTEMAFCLLLHRVYKLTAEVYVDMDKLQALGAAILGQTPDGKNAADEIQSTLTKFRDSAAAMDRALRGFEMKYLDPKAGNAHVAALGLRSMLTRSLFPMLTPIREQPEWGSEIFRPEDNVFKILVTGHEHVCDAYEQMLATRFEWWMSLHFHPESLAALTGQLCQRPTGSLSDRGWKVIERIYEQHPELLDVTQKQHRVQARYAIKAWEAREGALIQAGQIVKRPPVFIGQLQEALVSSDSQSSGRSALTSTPTSGQQASQQTTELDPLLGGYDSSGMAWSSWGGFSTDNSGQLSDALLESYLGRGDMSQENVDI